MAVENYFASKRLRTGRVNGKIDYHVITEGESMPEKATEEEELREYIQKGIDLTKKMSADRLNKGRRVIARMELRLEFVSTEEDG